MPVSYDVEECKIFGNEIRRVYNLPNFNRLIFRLNENPTYQLNLDVFAADVDNNRLPGTVTVTRLGFRNRRLRNAIDPDFGNDFIITKDMIDDLRDDFEGDFPVDLTVDSIELKAKKYVYLGTDYPGHRRRHFVGYKAVIKRHR